MKLVTFVHPSSEQRLGVLLSEARVLDLTAASGGSPELVSMLSLIEAGATGLEMATAVASRAEHRSAEMHPLGEIRLLAPIPRPHKNVFCVGLNFRSHVEQNARALGAPVEIPDLPLFFSKPVTAVIGPDEPIVLDRRLTEKLDYEVELAVVIGSAGTWIPREAARRHIFGYTLVNDVSARDLQWRTSQFFYGKGLDTYCPMGPALVTADELPDVHGVLLELYVNGEQRQAEAAGNMLFAPEVAIAELSKGITLEPGDVISLGTPGGCGYQRDPATFLCDGDRLECRATVIGSLGNPVRAI